jgi:hypothetical protein
VLLHSSYCTVFIVFFVKGRNTLETLKVLTFRRMNLPSSSGKRRRETSVLRTTD